MKNLPSTSVLLASTLLFSCSDHESKPKSYEESIATAVSSQPMVAISNNPSTPISTVELNSTPELIFDYNRQLDINISFTKPTTGALKICRVNDKQKIAINNCLVSTRLLNSGYQDTLTLGNDVTSLAVQIVTFENPITIKNYYWNRNNNIRWEINITR